MLLFFIIFIFVSIASDDLMISSRDESRLYLWFIESFIFTSLPHYFITLFINPNGLHFLSRHRLLSKNMSNTHYL